eukprot:tig00001576_g9362.t1
MAFALSPVTASPAGRTPVAVSAQLDSSCGRISRRRQVSERLETARSAPFGVRPGSFEGESPAGPVTFCPSAISHPPVRVASGSGSSEDGGRSDVLTLGCETEALITEALTAFERSVREEAPARPRPALVTPSPAPETPTPSPTPAPGEIDEDDRYAIAADLACSEVLTEDNMQLFLRILQTGWHPSPRLFNLVLKRLCDSRRVDLAVGALRTLQECGGEGNEASYAILISACRKANRLEEAVGLFEEMPARGVRPNEYVYTQAIVALGRRNRIRRAHAVFQAMLESGVEASAVAYGAMIDVWGRACRLDRAQATFEAMRAAGVPANEVVYDALLNACARAADLPRAFQVLRAMQEEAGLSPGRVSYNALIKCCSRAGDLERAYDVLHRMREAGVRPNRITYSTLIGACGRAGQLDRAFDAFDEMEAAGQRADFITYSALYHACLSCGNEARAEAVREIAAAAGLRLARGVPREAPRPSTSLFIESRTTRLSGALQADVARVRGAAEGSPSPLLLRLPAGPAGPRSRAGSGKPRAGHA